MKNVRTLAVCVLMALLTAGCYRLAYDRYDFTTRPPVSVDHIEVYTTRNQPKGQWKAVIGMVYGPQLAGGPAPPLEEAVAKFKEKAAAMGCDAVYFLGLNVGTDQIPARFWTFDGMPYYTGAHEVSTGCWTAKGIVFE